jgi:zinc protease
MRFAGPGVKVRSIVEMARLLPALIAAPAAAALTFAAAAGLAYAAAPPAAPAPAISPAARAAWGFDRSDLPPHPGVRFGMLANGMRYAVMRSAVPAGGLSLRLRVDVGAAAERDDERGFTHLVEHMVFHGTPGIPEGALPMMLSQRGLRRWTDFNAFTSYDETVYRLDMGRSDAAARETSLRLMREIAGNLAFGRAAVAGAKLRVREEILARDAAQDGILVAQNRLFAPGTPIARGPVAGTPAEVARAAGPALRRLYEAYYVPERTVLVLVGDVDPDQAEAEIAALFADWRARGGPAPDPAAPAFPPRRPLETALYVHPAAATLVTIAVPAPLGGADAGRSRDAHFLEHLAGQMLNRRLARLAAAPGAPFTAADHAAYDHFATVRLARIELEARDRDWRGALRAGAAELRRALADGFTQAELDAQLAAARAGLARSAAPRGASALADAIVDAAGRGIVFTEPADSAGTEVYLARIRLADVNAAFRAAWAGPARLVFVAHHRRIPGGEPAIAAAWREAAAAR